MELKNYFAQDSQGNALPVATCYLYQPGTEVLVEGLVNVNNEPLSNPFASGESGLIQFAAPNGRYDLRVVQGGRDYRVRVQCNDVNDAIDEVTGIKAEIRNRYYGTLAEDPITRPDGTEMEEGDEYHNTVSRSRRVFVQGAWTAFLGASTADLADDSDAQKGAGMAGFSHAVNYPPGTLGAHARRFVSVKDKPFNAAGNGVADDADAIEAAFSSGAAEVNFPAGNYMIGRNVTRPANVIVVMEPGANITGAQVLSSGVALAQPIPVKRIFGKLEIRDRKATVSHTDGFETAPHMGQLLRLDAKAEPGQCAVYLSGDQRAPVIGSTHYVGLHSRHNNSAECPNLWGYNPVVVKNIRAEDSPTGKSGVLGIEISLSNNTDEAGIPLASGELSGCFISYIHVENRASAALSTGGLSAGFNNLLWLDGVAPDGTHIALRDEVSANAGARRGLDTSAVSQFSEAAILLGNGHIIAGRRSDTGAVVPVAKFNASNQVAIGDADHAIRMQGATTMEKGSLELGTSSTTQSYIDFHSSGNPNDFDARLYVTGGNASDGNANVRLIAASAAFTGSIIHYTDNTHPFGKV